MKFLFKTVFISLLSFSCIINSHAQRTPTLGTSQQFNATTTSNARVTRIDDTHFLLVYKDGNVSSGSDLYGRVCQVDTSNKTISYGTATLIESDVMRYGNIVVLNSTQAVVVYEREETTAEGTSKLITFNTSTNTLSAGSRQQFYNGDIDAAFSHNAIGITRLDSVSFAIVYSDQSNGDDGIVQIGSVSGSTLSYGTQQKFSTGDVQNFWITALAKNKIFITYENDGSSDKGVAIVGEISGTTVTFGTPAEFESSAVSWTACTAVNGSQVAIMYIIDDTDDYGYAKVATVSCTDITFSSSSYQFEGAIDARDLSSVHLRGDEFIVAFNSGGGSGTDSKVRVGQVSGWGTSASISYSTAQNFLSTEGDGSWVTALNESTIAIGYVDDADASDDGNVTVGTLPNTAPTSTTLGLGDFAFVGYNADGGDDFSFMLFKDIAAGTVVNFTDKGWQAAGGFRVDGSADCNSENTIVWTSGSALSAGDIVTIGGFSASNGTVAPTPGGCPDLSLTSAGEALFAYQGTTPSSSDQSTFIAAINMNGGWDTDGTSTSTSAEPCSFTDGVNSVVISPEIDNAVYQGPIAGNLEAIYTSINDASNWVRNNTTAYTLPDDIGPQSSAPTISITAQTNVACSGASTGSLTATTTPGTANYSYVWSNGFSENNTSSLTSTNSSLAAGTYTVTVTDNNSLTATASATITQPSALSATATTGNNVSCNGGSNGSASTSGSGGTTPYTYTWSNGGTTSSITNLVSGTYTVTITDANGCTTTDNTSISQPIVLASSASVTSALDCNGDTDGQVTGSATGGTTPYTYSWNTGETNAIETNLGAGTYSVTITDQNGCTDSTSVTMTQPTSLVSSASVTSTLDCNGDTNGQVTGSATGGTTPYTYSWNTGETNAIETNLGAGTYSVTITDQNGCTDSTSVTLTEPSNLVSSASVTSTLDCNGDTDGQVTGSATGGTTPYTYSWNTGETNAIETNLGAGTYSVTITDQNGCTDSASTIVTEPAVVVASSVVDSNTSCNGFSDGGATAAATGGTGAYTYSWNNGATTASITGVVAGTYSVTITDQNGCTDSASTIVTEPAVVVASSVVDSNTSCNGFSDGGATAAATGGTGAYTYSWNNGATTASITGVVAGTYSVTITDQNGCTDSASTTIAEPEAIIPFAEIDNDITCSGGFSDGGITSTPSGGTGSYTYSWSDGGTLASMQGLTSGAYTVTVTDGNGCTGVDHLFLSDPTTISATATTTANSSCNGGSDGVATASASGGTGIYTYSWSNGANTVSNTGLSAGTYTVTITDDKGCTESDATTITEPTSLSINLLQVTNTDCDSTNGSLSVSGVGGTAPYSYLWSNSATTDSIGDLGFGNYNVTVTDNNNCAADSAFKVLLTDPTCDAPINLRTQFIQDTGATLKWDKLAGAISYKVVIKVQGNATWDATYFTGSNVAQQKVTNLTPNTKYKWSVMARRPVIGWTRLALPAKFSSLANPCINPGGIFVSGRSHDQVKLNWVNEVNTVRYRISYREKGTSTWLATTAAAGITKKWLTGLKADTEYEWRIKSVCEFGESSGNQWSSIKVFKTRVAPPPSKIIGGNSYISSLDEYIEWTLYPNPTTGKFTIEIENGEIGNEVLSIYDISGKSIYTTLVNNTRMEVDLSKFDQGIYLLNYGGQHQRIVLTK